MYVRTSTHEYLYKYRVCKHRNYEILCCYHSTTKKSVKRKERDMNSTAMHTITSRNFILIKQHCDVYVCVRMAGKIEVCPLYSRLYNASSRRKHLGWSLRSEFCVDCLLLCIVCVVRGCESVCLWHGMLFYNQLNHSHPHSVQKFFYEIKKKCIRTECSCCSLAIMGGVKYIFTCIAHT